MLLKKPSDKPRLEIERLARRAIETHGGPDLARVWYKFSCGSCGSRETTPDANVLPLSAMCAVCSHVTRIRGAGFALEIRKDRFVNWDAPTPTLVIRPQYASDRGDA